MLLMLSQWLQGLSPEFGFLRVFQYLTMRAVMAALTALVIGLLAGPRLIDQMRCRQRGKILETASLQRQSAGGLRCQGAQALDGRRFAVDGVDAPAGIEQHAAFMARATAQIDGRFICRTTRQRVKRLHQQGGYLASLGKAVVVRPTHGCDACGVISPSTTG